MLEPAGYCGREQAKIVEPRTDDVIDLVIVNGPIHMDEQVSKSSHLLKASCVVSGEDSSLVKQGKTAGILFWNLMQLFGRYVET